MIKNISISLICAILIQCASFAGNPTVADISQNLQNMPRYAGQARYEMLLGTMPEAQTYNITLRSDATPGDTLSPCRYIIRWLIPGHTDSEHGFAAYFDGEHYRFRNNRFTEYHFSDNQEPFAPMGNAMRGVQRMATFTNILPQFIGETLNATDSDTSYLLKIIPDTIVDGNKVLCINGIRRFGDILASEFSYSFDPETYLPLKISIENNPGQTGEQIITVNYSYTTDNQDTEINYANLSSLEPEAFEIYRQKNMAVEQLPGHPLPRIMAPTNTGERYLHEYGAPLAYPTLFVFIDSASDKASDIVRDIRRAVAAAPEQTDVTWIFMDTRTDAIDDIIPGLLAGENILVNGRGIARHCGVDSEMPVILFVKKNGIVSEIHSGINNDFLPIVIQKTNRAGRR